jgi:hypothetical protein
MDKKEFEERLVTLNVMVPRWLKDELTEAAWRQRWTLSQYARHVLSAAVTPVRTTQAEPVESH